MSRRKAHAGGHANSERWLLTYADLITLLLIYFIVLFAMSEIDQAKYHKLADAMSNAFNVIPSQGGSSEAVLPPASKLVMPPVAPMYTEDEENTFKRLDAKIEQISKSLAKGSLEVHETERGIVISIKDSALFAAGSADLNPAIGKVLGKVAAALAGSGNNIRIEGHTDDTPIQTARFPSNWELSTARAVNVLHYLIDRAHLSPSRLSAAGYGEYFPRVPNTSETNRSKNRRVDIVLLRGATMAQEPSRPYVADSAKPSGARPPAAHKAPLASGIERPPIAVEKAPVISGASRLPAAGEDTKLEQGY